MRRWGDTGELKWAILQESVAVGARGKERSQYSTKAAFSHCSLKTKSNEL